MGGSYTKRVKSIKQLKDICPVFYGYSMYEVDGVFFDSKNDSPIEERTQVIRLMFKFQIDELLKSQDGELRDVENKIAKLVTDDFLNYCANKPAFFELHIEDYKKQWPNHIDFIKTLIDRLQHWEFSMAMFVMGYVVFEICEKIKDLHKNDHRKPEEEIWITSFWNLRINRVTKAKGVT